MPARAIVLPEEQGIDALRLRLAVLTARGPVLVVACRGPVRTLDDVLRAGVRFDNLLVLDAKPTERPAGPPDLDPTLYSFGPDGGGGQAIAPRPARATIVIDDLPTLFGGPSPDRLLEGVGHLAAELFPAGADVEYILPRGMVPPEAWHAIVGRIQEVLPLGETGRLER